MAVKQYLSQYKYQPVSKMIASAQVIDSPTLSSRYKNTLSKSEDLDAIGQDNRDLMIMRSVLVSVGMNKNDDVFVKDEILPIRETGAFKPVNIEHDEDKVVGTIIRTFITDKEGNEIDEQAIAEDSSLVPDTFDITNDAAIWQFYFPEMAQEIREKAEAGELFVSIEAWFTDFDFLVGSKIVERNQRTAPILEPVLRINGGDGIFEGQKVGRVLRDMIVGGVGIVANPANPGSVIKSIASFNVNDVPISDKVICSNIIGDVSNKNEEIDMDKVTELTNLVKALKSQLDSLKTDNAALVNKVADVETNMAAASRTVLIKDEFGVSDEFISTYAANFASLDQGQFEAYVEFLKAFKNEVAVTVNVDSDQAVETTEASSEAEVVTASAKSEDLSVEDVALVEEGEESNSQEKTTASAMPDLDKVEIFDPVIDTVSDSEDEGIGAEMTKALSCFLGS